MMIALRRGYAFRKYRIRPMVDLFSMSEKPSVVLDAGG
jgi:hypothetical protein